IDAKVLDDARKIVDMACAPGSIQPELDQISVIANQLLQFRDVVVVIRSGILIFRIVSIPRRKIDAKFQAEFPNRVCDLPYQVPAPTLPGAALYAVVGLLSWP